jgi:hypothetical protein
MGLGIATSVRRVHSVPSDGHQAALTVPLGEIWVLVIGRVVEPAATPSSLPATRTAVLSLQPQPLPTVGRYPITRSPHVQEQRNFAQTWGFLTQAWVAGPQASYSIESITNVKPNQRRLPPRGTRTF